MLPFLTNAGAEGFPLKRVGLPRVRSRTAVTRLLSNLQTSKSEDSYGGLKGGTTLGWGLVGGGGGEGRVGGGL